MLLCAVRLLHPVGHHIPVLSSPGRTLPLRPVCSPDPSSLWDHLHWISHGLLPRCIEDTIVSKGDMARWVVVGVSGVTCGGKTTFATALHQAYTGSVIIHQDHYFLPPDDPRHILVPELGHLNWEIPSSLDMARMYKDVDNVLSRPPPVGTVSLLILEGFLILSDPYLSSLCHHKLLFTLTREVCEARRSARVYDPPDVPGYFSQVVWPEYERQLQLALALNPDMNLVSGNTDSQELLQQLKLTLDSQLPLLKSSDFQNNISGST